MQISVILDVDLASIPAATAIAPDGDQSTCRRTSSTAPANGLGKDRIRANAVCRDEAVVFNINIGPGIAGPAAAATDSDKPAGCVCGSTASTNALGKESASLTADCRDFGIVDHKDITGTSAAGTVTTQPDKAGTNSTCTTAATDTLGKNAISELAPRADLCSGFCLDFDIAAIARCTAITPKTDKTAAYASIPSAAADALREDRVAATTISVDPPSALMNKNKGARRDFTAC